MPINPNSVILYQGPSILTGDPIVAIATGLKTKSKNPKTADMVQTWIIRSDVHPMDAIYSGRDKAICGDCIHRARWYQKKTRSVMRRSCYVNMRGVISIYNAFRRGSYAPCDELHRRHMRARNVRIGSYGDGSAVPYSVWAGILPPSDFDRTGYTHQWESFPDIDPGFRNILMASVDSESEEIRAISQGWRVFRVIGENEEPTSDTIQCPSDPTIPVNKHVSCEDCGACHGLPGNSRKTKSRYIRAHGPTATYFGRPSLPVIH